MMTRRLAAAMGSVGLIFTVSVSATVAEPHAEAHAVFDQFLTVANDAETGRDVALVTVVLSGGAPLTAFATPLADADNKQVAEARLQDAKRARRDVARGQKNNPPQALFAATRLKDLAPTSVWQLTYENGAQQVMTINKSSLEPTFGPVVGGC